MSDTTVGKIIFGTGRAPVWPVSGKPIIQKAVDFMAADCLHMQQIIRDLQAANLAFREALIGVTPSGRGRGCWCHPSCNVEVYGHSAPCLAAQLAIKGDA